MDKTISAFVFTFKLTNLISDLQTLLHLLTKIHNTDGGQQTRQDEIEESKISYDVP